MTPRILRTGRVFQTMVEGSLRGRHPPPTLGPGTSAVDDAGDGVGAMVEGAGEAQRKHKVMNPTTRKVHCRFHADVVVKRHKLRTAAVLTPCWRCLEVRKDRVGRCVDLPIFFT